MKLYFSVLNPKDLGLLKNYPNYQVDHTDINTYLNESLSFKVCEAISKYLIFINSIENKKEKDDFKSADLAFKYLICSEDLNLDEAASIIKNINQKYYYDIADEKSKLIDIYKSTSITAIIEKEVLAFKKNKKDVVNQ